MRLIADKELSVLESDSRVYTNVMLRTGDVVDISATGKIWAGVRFTGSNGPRGWMSYHAGHDYPLSGKPPFSLLGFTDEDGYFYVGDRYRYVFANPTAGPGETPLSLEINDNRHGSGSGSFQVRIRVWRDSVDNLSQVMEVQGFSGTQLLDALRLAEPGERLDFSSVSTEEMEAAVRELSDPWDPTIAPEEMAVAAPLIDLGPHVSARSYWWGMRVELDHEAMVALRNGGAATALAAVGVNAFVAAIIAGVIGIWYAFDRGNGVIFFVSWSGVHWFTPR